VDTNRKNQRYIGLNLHLNDATVQSLDMVRIKGSMTAESGLDLVKKRSEDFGLTLQELLPNFNFNPKHIVGMVTDGALVMVKQRSFLPSSSKYAILMDFISQFVMFYTRNVTMKRTLMKQQKLMSMTFARALMMTNLGK